jgi:hypothetical protein
MTHIDQSLHVRCPPDRARESLREMLLSDAESGAPHPLLLSVKIPWTGIELAKMVSVEYTITSGPTHIDEPIGIRWTPEPGGMYPSFDGELRVLEGRHAYSSILELVGHYAPPLGAIGSGFDAAVGHRIAEATIEHVLEGLASGIMASERIGTWERELSRLHEEEEARSHVRVVTATVVQVALPP